MTTESKTNEAPAPAAEAATPQADLVPSSRLREETTKRTEATTARDAAVSALADLSKRFEALEADHTKAKSNHSQDLALFGAGISDGEVRDFVRSRYTPEENDGGFDGWLSKQQENPSPLLAPFLGGKKAEAPAAAVAEKPAAPKTDAGASQPAAHNQKTWSLEDIKTSAAKGDFSDKKKDIMAALRAEGLVK
jgi:hypothetical protein